MNRVFIELYLDEDVSVVLADLVRSRSFRVTTTQEAGLVGTTDAEQVAARYRSQQGYTDA